jgi:hypothetical protein
MNKQFEALEKKLNIASTLIDELQIEDYEVVLPSDSNMMLELSETHPVGVAVEESTLEIFTLETLKSDFAVIRQSVLKLIATGQRILESASVLDPADIKPATLTALSQMQVALGSHMQMLLSIYEQVAKIELTRSKTKAPATTNQPAGGLVNQGTVNNNNIIFSGDTNQLLAFMKENQNT